MSRLLRIWRRVAPTARIRAISRDRWVTIIVKVFQMMNEPTNKAMPAKIMNMMLTNFRSSLTASEVSCATCAPVTASAASGTAASSRFARAASVTPSSARTLMASNVSGDPSTFCAVAVSK